MRAARIWLVAGMLIGLLAPGMASADPTWHATALENHLRSRQRGHDQGSNPE